MDNEHSGPRQNPHFPPRLTSSKTTKKCHTQCRHRRSDSWEQRGHHQTPSIFLNIQGLVQGAEAFLLLCSLTDLRSTKHLGLKKLPIALSNSSALGSLPSSLETRHRPRGTHQVHPENVRAFVGHCAVWVYSRQCGRKLVLTSSAQCHSTGCTVTTQGPAPLAACAISSLAS